MTTPAPTPSWWTRCTTLFSDEQRATLTTDDTHDCDTRSYVYEHTPDPPEHHAQLLDALQLGRIDDAQGLFRARLDHSFTSAGRHTLRKWLEHPLLTAEDVQLRRSLREVVVHDAPGKTLTLQDTRGTLASMEEAWRALTWCWHDDKSKTELLHHLLFGHVFTPLNDVPLAQNAYHHMRVVGSPLIQCLAPLVPVVLSFVMLKWMGAEMSFSECWAMSSGVFKNAFWFDQSGGGGAAGSMLVTLMRIVKWLWWLLFVANVALMLYHSYRHYSLLTHVHRRVYQAAKWVASAQRLVKEAMGGGVGAAAATTPDIAAIVEWVNTASPSHGIFTNAHGFLSTYRKLRSPGVRQTCEGWVRHVGVLDAAQSVTRLLERDAFVVPEVVGNTEAAEAVVPTLELTQAFHPLLDADQQMRHDLTLDKHIVLTGANASGKSTVLKTMLLNVLLAQTWGVACAGAMRWTPFGILRGYLHTVDDCGRESLFQAQIRRIEAFIAAARKAAPATGPALLVVDEILNSTNPIEAMLLSYQYARIVGDELGGSARMAMTTHYPVLTTLATKYPTQFANWAMGEGYALGVGDACHASSAIGTVKAMTQVLDEDAHRRLEKAYKRMYKRLRKMRFRELDGDDNTESARAKGGDTKEGMPTATLSTAPPLAPTPTDPHHHPSTS